MTDDVWSIFNHDDPSGSNIRLECPLNDGRYFYLVRIQAIYMKGSPLGSWLTDKYQYAYIGVMYFGKEFCDSVNSEFWGKSQGLWTNPLALNI